MGAGTEAMGAAAREEGEGATGFNAWKRIGSAAGSSRRFGAVVEESVQQTIAAWTEGLVVFEAAEEEEATFRGLEVAAEEETDLRIQREAKREAEGETKGIDGPDEVDEESEERSTRGEEAAAEPEAEQWDDARNEE